MQRFQRAVATCAAAGVGLALAACGGAPHGDAPYGGLELRLQTDDDGWLEHGGAALPWIEVGDDGDDSAGDVRAADGFIAIHGSDAMVCRPMLVSTELEIAWIGYAIVGNDAAATPLTVEATFHHFADLDDYLDNAGSLERDGDRGIGSGSSTTGTLLRYGDDWTARDVVPSLSGTTAPAGVVAACLRIPRGADDEGAEIWIAGAKAAVGNAPAPYESVLDDE